MEPVMIVENPDGTNSVLAVHSNTSFQPNNVPTEDAGPAKAKSQSSSAAQAPLVANPFAELDASAATELQRMKKQDEVYLGQHAPAHEVGRPLCFDAKRSLPAMSVLVCTLTHPCCL
jgi:hypothetical protein